MRSVSRLLLAAFLITTAAPAMASRIQNRAVSAKHKTSKAKKSAAAARPRAIDDKRATEIQTALVKAGYLQEVSGHWDNQSQAAMQKMQGDNGWQTKLIPDSRALIKLGLGPNGRTDAASSSALTLPSTVEDQHGN